MTTTTLTTVLVTTTRRREDVAATSPHDVRDTASSDNRRYVDRASSLERLMHRRPIVVERATSSSSVEARARRRDAVTTHRPRRCLRSRSIAVYANSAQVLAHRLTPDIYAPRFQIRLYRNPRQQFSRNFLVANVTGKLATSYRLVTRKLLQWNLACITMRRRFNDSGTL